ncbi:hypothetical protein DFH05DRAFT_1464274 [Lentinula detonsa]|uniref:Tat pathway signal sequence n=1 Tax=Lentinula detonsa TaxID=2804962 RepID=A0A9W8NQV1_9AGAR|nr:hypothetical protein DFH05DRAFT_1464274 [Lentinula detonsa]
MTRDTEENLPLFSSPVEEFKEFKDLDLDVVKLKGPNRDGSIGETLLRPRTARYYTCIIIIQAIFNLFVLGRYWHNSGIQCSPLGSPLRLVYSPAQEAIEYNLLKFAFGFGDDITPYQGVPSPQVDAAWSALYPYPAAAVPKSEAAKMANKTSPIPGDETNYMVTDDDGKQIPEVFHTLHCLNTIRKALHPEYYNFTASELDRLLFREKHMDHCIDAIRQSLMCSGDVTPLVWAWDEKRNMTLGRTDIVHECRNFSKIQEWAEVHRMKGVFNESIHVENDLEIPILY